MSLTIILVVLLSVFYLLFKSVVSDCEIS